MLKTFIKTNKNQTESFIISLTINNELIPTQRLAVMSD